MVQLLDTDIRTREVLEWTGLHVFSRPIIVVLAEIAHLSESQGHDWVSHPIDGPKKETLARTIWASIRAGLCRRSSLTERCISKATILFNI